MLGVILARSKFALHQFYVKCHSNLAASSKPGRRRRSQRSAAKPKADESVEITLMFTGAVVQTAIRPQGVEPPQGGPSRPDSTEFLSKTRPGSCPTQGFPTSKAATVQGAALHPCPEHSIGKYLCPTNIPYFGLRPKNEMALPRAFVTCMGGRHSEGRDGLNGVLNH